MTVTVPTFLQRSWHTHRWVQARRDRRITKLGAENATLSDLNETLHLDLADEQRRASRLRRDNAVLTLQRANAIRQLAEADRTILRQDADIARLEQELAAAKAGQA